MTYPKIGEDIVPPDPGEEGNIGLIGIDVDQDGVRDDVEIILSDVFSNQDSRGRIVAMAFSRDLQNITKEVDSLGINQEVGETLVNKSFQIKSCYSKNLVKSMQIIFGRKLL